MFIIALVLFFIGFFVSILLFFRQWTDKAREEFEMMVEIADHSSSQDTAALGSLLRQQPFVASMRYVSKEEAGLTLDTALIRLLDGLNPLPASYNIRIRADWVNKDSIQKINKTLDIPAVASVTYPIDEIESTTARLSQLIPIAFAAGIIVMIVAFFIINSTVRLAIFSRRLVIRSMQLIGATNGFIRRPFIRMGILQGLLGALLANVLIVATIFGISRIISNVNGDPAEISAPGGNIKPLDFVISPEFLTLAGSIVLFGTLIGWVSSWLAVNRFLNRTINELM